MTALRTVLLGTPQFAVPSLRLLHREAHLLAVVTQPDKPRGRGRRLTPPPVAALGRTLGVRVLQPPRLKSPEVLVALRDLSPDVIVTVAYGKLIPEEILELPPLGCINVHPSLLPKYRGASPIQAAIRDGERETGITIIYQAAELDAGDIILQRRVPIGPDETAATLEEQLARVGADALGEALHLLAAGHAPRIPQDPREATYVGKLTKDDGKIDWTQPANRLVSFVRAMNPWPSAYTRHRGKLVKIWRAKAVPAAGAPGTVVGIHKGEGFVVAAGTEGLQVLEAQPEGRRRVSGDDYARGVHLQVGERLV